MLRLRLVLALLIAVTVAEPRGIAEESSDHVFYAALRQRGMFALAENELERQILHARRMRLPQTELILELSRTLAEHAKFTNGEEQTQLFDRASRIVKDLLLEDSGRSPAKLKMQAALVLADEARFFAQHAAFHAHDSKARVRALSTGDAAQSDLHGLIRDLKSPTSFPNLGTVDRRRILWNAQLTLGGTILDLTALLPSGSPDRMSSLLDAEAILRALGGRGTDDEITWRSRLLEIRTVRLRGDLAKSIRLTQKLIADKPPAEILEAAVAENVQTMLDDDRPDTAAEQLINYRRQTGRLSGELHSLKLRSLLALRATARSRGRNELADELFDQAQRQIAVVQSEAPGYWSERCRALLQQAGEESKYGAELAEALRVARNAYSNRQWNEARAAFSTCVRLAEAADQSEFAAEFRQTIASIHIQQAEYAEAASVLSRLLEQQPNFSNAAAASLLRAWSLGQVHVKSGDAIHRNAYVSALNEHRRRFASDASVHEAAWMLAQTRIAEGAEAEALKLFASIDPSHPRSALARAEWLRLSEKLVGTNEFLQMNVRPVIDQLARQLLEFDRPWNSSRIENALRVAAILATDTPADYESADRLLQRVITGTSQVPANDRTEQIAQFRQRASQLRLLTLAARDRTEEAQALLENTASASVDELLGIVKGLDRVGSSAKPELRKALGNLQLRVLVPVQARRDQLTPLQATNLDRAFAAASLAAGRNEQAIFSLQQAAERHRRNKRELHNIAELLDQTPQNPAVADLGRVVWQRIERLNQPASPEWWQARLEVIRRLAAAGQTAEAKKLMRVTRLLYPDPGGAALRKQFEDVERGL